MAILSAVVASRCAISSASRLVALAGAQLPRELAVQLGERAVAAEQLRPAARARGRRPPGRAVTSRSRMASEFTATRIWKPSRGSAAVERRRRLLAQEVGDGGEKLRGGGPVLRHQRASFRSCSRSTSVSTARRPIEAISIDFTEPERCFHAWVRQMMPQRTVPNTSHQCARAGSTSTPPALLVGGPQLLAAAEAAGRLVDRAEAPALDAHPAEILDRIAEMGALPVEDRGHAALVGEIVAGAEVAVHQQRPRGRRRAGAGRARRAPARTPAAAGRACRAAARRRRPGRPPRDAVERRQGRRDRPRGCAPRSRRAGARSSCARRRRADRAAACGRSAMPPIRRMTKASPRPSAGAELEQHFRRADAAAWNAARSTPNSVARSSEVERSRSLLAADGRRIAAQDQLVALAADDGVEAPGLARGAARFASQSLDRRRPAEVPRGRRCQARARRGRPHFQCERSFTRTVAQALPRGKRAALMRGDTAWRMPSRP